jgi:hypothetical protein
MKMKKLFVLVVFTSLIFFAAESFAATKISWSAPTTGGAPANYTLNYSDGTTAYNKTVPATQTEILLADLNLAYGKTYTFTVSASNVAGTGPASNQVDYVVPAYTSPVDKLPPTVIQLTGPITITIN